MGLFGRSSEDHGEREREGGRESPEWFLRDAERVASDAERQLREQLWSSMIHGDRLVLLCLNGYCQYALTVSVNVRVSAR